MLLLFSTLALAGYNVLARNLTKKFSAKELSVATITMSFIFYNTVSILRHYQSGTISAYFAPLTHPSFLISVVYCYVSNYMSRN